MYNYALLPIPVVKAEMLLHKEMKYENCSLRDQIL